MVKEQPSVFKILPELYVQGCNFAQEARLHDSPNIVSTQKAKVTIHTSYMHKSLIILNQIGDSINHKWGVAELTRKITPPGAEISSTIWA